MTVSLADKHIILGVTGGIAAYKACELTSRLRKAGADVHVIMTEHACKFVCPQTFETLSNNPVVYDMFDPRTPAGNDHLTLAAMADLVIIAPATANIMGKIANGIADDMLTATILATKAPLFIAPAMNTGMWNNEVTQQNAVVLKERGVTFIGPDGGFLACGDTGKGRMSEPSVIFQSIQTYFSVQEHDLTGVRVLVTAGPTIEPIDPVRYITNRSTGKMGYAIATAAAARGAEVTLLSGPVSLSVPEGIRVVPFTNTASLYDAMMSEAPNQDVIIQSAAPADFTPADYSPVKIKKNSKSEMTITLKPTPDVAEAIGKIKKNGQVFVGFAAETDHVTDNAGKKLTKKNLDMIVANDVTKAGAGFGTDTNIVTLITKDGMTDYPMMTKHEVAMLILDRIKALRNE